MNSQSEIKLKIYLETNLSVHSTTHGEPECEELCRNDKKCVGFNFIKSKCFLKSSLETELKSKMSISGKKFQPDYNGDPLKGTVECCEKSFSDWISIFNQCKLTSVKSI